MDLALIIAVEVLCVVTAWRIASRSGAGATGPMFVSAAFVFHGLIEVARLVLPPPRDDTFFSGYGDIRKMVSEESVHVWRLWAMVAIVAFTLVYALSMLWRSEPPVVQPRPEKLRYFPWFVTAPISVLLWPALLRSGQENVAAGGLPARTDYWAGGLANQFLLLLVALAIIDFSLRRNVRWAPTLGALAIGCLSILVIGQRLEVVAVATMSLGALWWFGIRTSRRMAIVAGGLILLSIVTLTLARSQVGRQEFIEGGASSRLQTLASATNGITDKENASYAASNMANRFDGNGFPALVLEAQEQTEWRSGLGPFEIGANLTIPSFLNPAKNSSGVEDRSEKEYVKAGYGMLFDFDYLPTQFGSALAMGGPATLLAFAAIAGLAFALFDRYLRRRTEARLILGLTVADSIIANYESDISSWPVALRSALVFLAVIGIGMAVRRLALGPATPVHPIEKAAKTENTETADEIEPTATPDLTEPEGGGSPVRRSPRQRTRPANVTPVAADPVDVLGFDPFAGDEREFARSGEPRRHLSSR